MPICPMLELRPADLSPLTKTPRNHEPTMARSCFRAAERVKTVERAVAQFGRALRSGRRGRWFKSSQPDLKTKQLVALICGELFLLR